MPSPEESNGLGACSLIVMIQPVQDWHYWCWGLAPLALGIDSWLERCNPTDRVAAGDPAPPPFRTSDLI